MGQVLLSNNAYTTLAVGCASGDATLTVASSTTFPAVTTASGNWFYACLQDTFANLEIVKVTNVTGTVWTVTRAIGGTTARAFVSSSVVELRLTAETLNDVTTYNVTTNIQNSTPQYLTSVAGTNTITATAQAPFTAYAAGQKFHFLAAATNTGAVTLNLNGIGAQAVTKGPGTTALVAGDLQGGQAYEAVYDGTGHFQLIGAGTYAASGANADISALNFAGGVTTTTQPPGDNSTKVATTAFVQAAAPQIQPISASVSANALTITASALTLDFRSTTLGSGTVTRVTGTPASLTIPSGATLGTVSATQSRLAVIAFNSTPSGGSGIELAVINIAGGVDLSETGLMSTLAISGASNSATAFYSTTLRNSPMAYRVIGYVESTQATAGTWATAPSTIQGYGGQALAAMSSLGYGQTWQNVSGSRVAGTTYFNTTGKPITVLISAVFSTSIVSVNGLQVANPSTTQNNSVTIVVPPGGSYSATNLTAGFYWAELR
jgi:hypothetical protein